MATQAIVFVLSEGRTASTDYFLFPHLAAKGYAPQLLDARRPAEEIPADTALVVISRYLPANWMKTLMAYRQRGGRLAYFMDDDLFDRRSLAGLPWRYGWKILRQAFTQRYRLRSLCSEFWVSTPYLAHKYAELSPRLLSPALQAGLLEPRRQVTIGYHATASHQAEFAWLSAVVERVQAEADNTRFELFGGKAIRDHYRHQPRVSVLHPMHWPDYLAWSGSERRDIALAPLLPSAFNAARGVTKFFDYARLGAAGIYSDVAPYRDFVRHGIDGLLVDNRPESWAEAILELAADEPRRQAIAEAARVRLLQAQQPAGPDSLPTAEERGACA